jgi:prevent-host-death family protein
MQYVTATEAKQELGALLDTAQRAPVTIRKHKRDYAVILSITEYERLREAAIQARQKRQEEAPQQTGESH